MAKDRRKLQHIHSSIADRQPTPQTLEVGEIAVNNAATKEFLSIKNSNDKVVRFSSDEQMITWMEKKEVMPYEGQVRGAVGPTGTKDSMGSYGITNDDLLQNKSNLIIKNNQVAAKNTKKYDKVNGAKDIYNKEVNPTSDSGLTDGAGFAVDMSRYAMIGANPGFSAATVSAQTNLSGNTYITNGASANTYGTDTGHTLAIKTTDVTANDTNWTETITNRTSTVTNETDKITTLNASATTANVSGNTLVLQEATSISAKTPTAYLSGTTLDVKETNTDITSCGRISANTNDFEVKQCAANGKFIVNSDDADVSGKTLDIIENTSVTVKTPAASVSGATLVADESTSISAKTPMAYLSGTTLDVKEANTDIQSCDRISANTNAFTVQECSAGSGKTVINQTDIDISGKTFDVVETTSATIKAPATTISGTSLTVDEGTSISAKTPSTTISGTNLTINEENTVISSCTKVDIVTNDLNIKQCTTGTVDFDFCNGFTVNSNNTKLHQCGSAGTISISAQTQNINGGNLTINESASTTVNTTGNTNISSTANICESAGATAAMVGATKTNVGKNCSDGGQTATLNLNGNTINETGTTVNISGSTAANVSGATVNVSGGSICETASDTAAFVGATKTNIGANCSDGGNTATLNVRGVTTNISAGTITQTTSGDTTINVGGALTENVTGATTENHTGAVTINNASGYTAYTTGNTCITSSGNLTMGGDGNTNIGYNCAGTGIANNVNIYASTGVTVNAPTTTINGTLNVESSGLSKTLSWSYGDVRTAASDSTNFKADKSFVMPKSVDHLTNYDGTNITLPHPVLVSGTVTASGAIYSSDRNLKENIDFVERDKINKVKNIFAKSYNFKSDESKTKTYGVIAQDVQDAGLPELVHITDDKGTLGVDYTSLFILKIAYLEDFCGMLNGRIVELENRIKELENKE